MDRRTPNNKIPLRNSRTPNFNSTTICGTSGHKAKSFNSSRRPNMDVTTVGSSSNSNPKIKSSLAVSVTDNDLECDLTYNEYLQSLLKRQIVAAATDQQKRIILEQLNIQDDASHKIKILYEKTRNDEEQLAKQSEVVLIINFLENNVNEMNNLLVQNEMENQLNRLLNLLNLECDKIVLKNIKHITNQKEYDSLIDTLKTCIEKLVNIQESGRDFKNIRILAEKIEKLVELKHKVEEKQLLLHNLQKDSAILLLQNASDMFAKKINYG